MDETQEYSQEMTNNVHSKILIINFGTSIDLCTVSGTREEGKGRCYYKDNMFFLTDFNWLARLEIVKKAAK